MAHRFSPAAERQHDDAVRTHESRKGRILAQPKLLRDALRDYFTDHGTPEEWDVLVQLCQTALTDEAEAGRQIAQIAQNAAHECARWQLGDDMEAVEPAEPYKPTFRPVDVSKMAAQLMGIPTELEATVRAARGIPGERK